jgi:hypothetical protein
VSKVYDQIFSTSDYSIFYNVDGNRKVRESHVERLIESIKVENRLHLHPIIVKKIDSNRLWVIDGQHRIRAAKKLQLPVYYLYDEGDLETAMIIDQNQRTWKLSDYLNYFCFNKYEEYLKIQEYISNYEIPLSAILTLLSRNLYEIGKVFKLGGIKMTQWVIDFIKDTHEMRHHIAMKDNGWKSTLYRRDFILALKWFKNEYGATLFKKLIEILKDNFGKMPAKSDKTTYEIELIDLMNRGGDKKSRLVHPKNKRGFYKEESYESNEKGKKIDIAV